MLVDNILDNVFIYKTMYFKIWENEGKFWRVKYCLEFGKRVSLKYPSLAIMESSQSDWKAMVIDAVQWYYKYFGLVQQNNWCADLRVFYSKKNPLHMILFVSPF